MSSAQQSRPPANNRLLSALPREEYERLLPHLEPVRLHKGRIIYEAGDTAHSAFFVNGGMISLLSTTEQGEVIEVAMVGSEGVTGIPIVLRVNRMPYRAMVQLPVDALRIKAPVLRQEFDRGGRFQHLLLCYTHALFTQVAQSAVCNRFHSVGERLCRWLLVSRERVGSDSFDLTQEFIAHMLGMPRSGVSAAAGALQKAGLIGYSRGRITILDREGLEEASCECYGVVADAIKNCLPS